MEFSRQEYWSGLPFPSPGDLPNSGIEPRSPALQIWATREHQVISQRKISCDLTKKKKEQSEKVGLKLNIQKLRSWHLVPSLHGK